MIAEAAFYGGARDQTTGAQVTLNFKLQRVHTVSTTSAGINIKLQSARQLNKGGPIGFVVNAGSNAFNLVNNSNTLLVVLDPGECVELALIDNTTAAGSWVVLEGTANFVADPPVNLYFYLLGGDPNTTLDTAQREYNSQTDVWSQKTDIPSTSQFVKGACAVYGTSGFYLYTDVGGANADKIASYDPDTWTILSASDAVTWSGCGMVTLGTSILCFDGVGGTGFRTREYVVSGDSWTSRTTRTSGHGIDYVMCGLANSKAVHAGGTSNLVDTYVVDTWTAKTTRPGANVWQCSTVARDNVLYLYGGLTTSGSLFISDVKTYTEATDTWASLSNLSTGRSGGASCAIGSYNYIAGGFLGTVGTSGTSADKTDANWEHVLSNDTYITRSVVDFVSTTSPAGVYHCQNHGAAITP